jgi:hypothetical protein
MIKLFTMVKDENDIILDWILYHGSIFGYNNLYIIDNYSTDGTFEIIQRFNNLINIYRESDYTQKGTYMTNLINKYCTKNDIAFPLDIDEFIVYYDKNNNKININKDIIVNYINNLPLYNLYKCAYLYPILLNANGYEKATHEINYASYNNYGSMAKSFINVKTFTGVIDHGNHMYNENYLLTNIVLVHYHHRNIEQHKKKNKNNIIGLGYKYDYDFLNNFIQENLNCDGFHHIKMFLDYHNNKYSLPYISNPIYENYINISVLKDHIIYLNNFDWKTYINNYEDLRNAGINTRELALQHWNNHGIHEGRTYINIIDNNFDWETYIDNYEDLRNAGINTKELALQHWNNHGKNENRTDKKLSF